MADNSKSQEKKETPISVISLSREEKLGVDIANPLNLDQLYASVPEITRAIDFRSSMIAPNGYEVMPRGEDDNAKKIASLCYQIIEYSGGISFFEQFHKNTDLYGNGYTELVSNQLKNIVELAHVHPYRFGYETESVSDPDNPSEKIDIIKVDKNTQKPIGFATYKLNPSNNELEIDKKIAYEKIAHLKFKTVGDSFYGISLVQPMIGSITRKVRLEDYADRAAKLIAVPKLVIQGEYESDDERKEDAREAANLDINDVIVLQGENAKVDFIRPGDTNIPALREMFITNITTASGIPRPALTSESAEINKATMEELMKNMRGIIKSNQLKISNLFEHIIFPRIAESYNIANYSTIIPKLIFLEDNDTAAANIDTVKRKAVALTSLANTYTILLNAANGVVEDGVVKKDQENGQVSKKSNSTNIKTRDNTQLNTIISEMEELLLNTIKQFKYNNDTSPLYTEDYKTENQNGKNTKREVENSAYIPIPNSGIELGFLDTIYNDFSTDESITETTKEAVKNNYKRAFTAYKNGYTVIDKNSEKILDINDFIEFKKKIGESNDFKG